MPRAAPTPFSVALSVLATTTLLGSLAASAAKYVSSTAVRHARSQVEASLVDIPGGIITAPPGGPGTLPPPAPAVDAVAAPVVPAWGTGGALVRPPVAVAVAPALTLAGAPEPAALG